MSKQPGQSFTETSARIGVVGAVAVALLATLLSGCTKPETKPPARPRPPLQTTVVPDLGRTGPLTYHVAGTRTRAAEGHRATVNTYPNTPALVAAYDDQHRQRGLGISSAVTGLTHGSVPVDFRSTAVSELLLSPDFVTSNPVAVLAIQHAASTSKRLGPLASELRRHAAADPGYLQHPTRSELTALGRLGEDVIAKLKSEEAKIARDHPSAKAPHLTGGHCLKELQGLRTGVCWTTPYGSHGDAPLHAASSSPSWTIFFSAGQPRVPLGLVPPKVIKIPALNDVLLSLVKIQFDEGKGLFCAVAPDVFGGHCDNFVWNELKQYFNPYPDASADLTVPEELTHFQLYGIEGSSPNSGDSLAVPLEHYRAFIEGWYGVAVALTIWTQFALPLIKVIDGTVEKNAVSTTKDRVADLLKSLKGPIKDKINTFGNDIAGRNIRQLGSDMLAVAEGMITDANIMSAFLALWQIKGSKLAAEEIWNLLEKYGPDAIPGGAWIKLAIQLGNLAGPVFNAGFGMYQVSERLADYPTYASYRALGTAYAPPTTRPTGKPTTGGGGGDHVPWPGAGHWANRAFDLKISAGGSVTITWRIGQWCSATVPEPCDRMKGDKIISGGVAKGHLKRGSGNGSITSSTVEEAVSTGSLTITRSGRTIDYLNAGGKDLIASSGAGPMYPV